MSRGARLGAPAARPSCHAARASAAGRPAGRAAFISRGAAAPPVQWNVIFV